MNRRRIARVAWAGGVLVFAGHAAGQNIATFTWLLWGEPERAYQGDTLELQLWVEPDPGRQGVAGSVFDITGGEALGELAFLGAATVQYAGCFQLGFPPEPIAEGWTVDVRRFSSSFCPKFDYCIEQCHVLTVWIDIPSDLPTTTITLECSGFHGAVGPVDVYTDSFGSPIGYEGIGAPAVIVIGGNCPADQDRDADTDADDVALFITRYTSSNENTRARADVNHDGVINGLDIGVFLQSYSEGC